MSSANDVSGNCGAVTVYPSACRDSMTALQHDPSAHAPWTRTMLSFSLIFPRTPAQRDRWRLIVTPAQARSLESRDSRQRVSQLRSDSDVEFGEDAIQVSADSTGREEQAFADLAVRQPIGRELSDLELLGGEAIAGVRCSATDCLARRSQLLSGALAPGRRAERIEQFDALTQRRPRVGATPLPAQPAAERKQRSRMQERIGRVILRKSDREQPFRLSVVGQERPRVHQDRA